MVDKVLVIDDSALIRKMYRMILSRYACEIVEAMNGQEALDTLAVQTDIQLIFVDINMPVMNGIQFLEKAAGLGIAKRLPIIVISTEGEDDKIRGLNCGARGYLKKPFNPHELHDLIAKIFPGNKKMPAPKPALDC